MEMLRAITHESLQTKEGKKYIEAVKKNASRKVSRKNKQTAFNLLDDEKFAHVERQEIENGCAKLKRKFILRNWDYFWKGDI